MRLVGVADIALAREPREYVVGHWLWIAPGGHAFGYPTDGFAHVHDANGVARAALVLPADARLPERRDFHGEVVAGLQAGALHPGGRRLAIATHERLVLLDSERGQLAERSLFDAAGAADDEDAAWFGDPGALAFSTDGRVLWFATTHVGATARVHLLDGETLAPCRSVDVMVEFPDPGLFTLAPHPARDEILWTVACGQDGGGFARLVWSAGALAVEPAARWLRDQHFVAVGFRRDGRALVLVGGELEVQDAGVPEIRHAVGAADFAVQVGAHVLVADDDAYRVLDAATLAPLGEVHLGGEVHALASGRMAIIGRDSLRIVCLT